MDRRTFGAVEHLGLYECLVYIESHLTAQCIDLPYEVSLARSSYRRVARHHGDRIYIRAEHRGLFTESGRNKTGLASSVTGSNYYNVILVFLQFLMAHVTYS